MISKYKIYTLYLLAFVGLLVSAYLWHEYSQPGAVTCQIGGCQSVRESDFATFLGLSVPIWGTLYYLAIVIYAMSLLFKRKLYILEQIVFLAVITGGLAFSIYLTFAELFVIKAICQWCVISAIMSVGIYFVGYWMYSPITVWKDLKRN